MDAFLPRRLHTVAVFSGAYGGLALLVAGLILISPNEWGDKVWSAPAFALLSLAGAMICLGLTRRRHWAWWLGVSVYGLFTLAATAAAVWAGVGVLFGWDGSHGVGSAGPFILLWFAGGIALLSGIPLWNLWHGRSALRTLSNPPPAR